MNQADANNEFLKASMTRAIALSLEKMQAGEGGPFGAVIIKDNHIIAEGWNQVTSCNDPTAHAEVVAIRNACNILGTFDLTGCTLVTSCEPCPMCYASSLWARLDAVYYGNTKDDAAAIGFDDAFFYEELQKPSFQKTMPLISLMRNEAQTAFQAWTKKDDRILY